MGKVRIEEEVWFGILNRIQQQMMHQAMYLIERERKELENRLFDYGFLVFSPAKVYEGFLKTFLYQMELIDEREYKSDHFRIGKALNPDLPIKYRQDGWVYEGLMAIGGRELAERLWMTWKRARNEVFHYKPEMMEGVTFEEAERRVDLIIESMKVAAECGLRFKSESEGR